MFCLWNRLKEQNSSIYVTSKKTAKVYFGYLFFHAERMSMNQSINREGFFDLNIKWWYKVIESQEWLLVWILDTYERNPKEKKTGKVYIWSAMDQSLWLLFCSSNWLIEQNRSIYVSCKKTVKVCCGFLSFILNVCQ